MSKGQPSKDPILNRKPSTGGSKDDIQALHQRDLAALAAAKRIEKAQTGCVTVRLESGTLTAKPETIMHILTQRGYRQSEIDEIMGDKK